MYIYFRNKAEFTPSDAINHSNFSSTEQIPMFHMLIINKTFFLFSHGRYNNSFLKKMKINCVFVF